MLLVLILVDLLRVLNFKSPQSFCKNKKSSLVAVVFQILSVVKFLRDLLFLSAFLSDIFLFALLEGSAQEGGWGALKLVFNKI